MPEKYTMKYRRRTRKISKAEQKGFPEGSGYNPPYIQSHDKDFLNFKSYTSGMVLPGRVILQELILRIGNAAGAIFSSISQQTKQYGPSRELACASTRKYTKSILPSLPSVLPSTQNIQYKPQGVNCDTQPLGSVQQGTLYT